MKKYIIKLSIILSFISNNTAFGQATSSDFGASAPSRNHPGYGDDYIGWAVGAVGAGLAQPSLDIKNEDNMPIMFYTDAGNGTYNNLRMIIYEDPTTAGVYNAGFVALGVVEPPRHLTIATFGTGVTVGTGLFGFPPSMVELLVAGGDDRPDTVQQVAEFRSTRGNSNSIGVRIRGARAGNVDADCAHINFDNFFLTEEEETDEFNLARISADVRRFNTDEAGASGYFRIKTVVRDRNSGSEVQIHVNIPPSTFITCPVI